MSILYPNIIATFLAFRSSENGRLKPPPSIWPQLSLSRASPIKGVYCTLKCTSSKIRGTLGISQTIRAHEEYLKISRMESESDKDEYMSPNEDSKSQGDEIINSTGEASLEEDTTIYEHALKASSADGFDIAPLVAVPCAAPIHSMTFSRGPKWMLLGGEDGFIRKYDFTSSVEGKNPLTVAQRHLFVDSVTNAGLLQSYWENEQPVFKSDLGITENTAVYEPRVSPVYSIAVQSEAQWLLSGLASGGITLQSIRHDEGKIQHYFRHQSGEPSSVGMGHSDAVSVLKIDHDETGFLSGSWDKSILQWDLNTGEITNRFLGASQQISSIEFRPMGGCEIFGGTHREKKMNAERDLDSLFGESDDEMGKEENKGVEEDEGKDKRREDQNGEDEDEDGKGQDENGQDEKRDKQREGGETEDEKNDKIKDEISNSKNLSLQTSKSVFLSSSIDGTLNIWDNRLKEGKSCILRIPPPMSTPPWGMSASWSASGDSIFIGRRNATVDEFSMKMPFSQEGGIQVSHPVRTLKFPSVSGPVSVVKPMLNGHHLLCGSFDNVRLYDLRLHEESTKSTSKRSAVPFMIIPGHHGGCISDMYIDPSSRFLVSASANRGWQGTSTETVLIYEIDAKV